MGQILETNTTGASLVNVHLRARPDGFALVQELLAI